MEKILEKALVRSYTLPFPHCLSACFLEFPSHATHQVSYGRSPCTTQAEAAVNQYIATLFLGVSDKGNDFRYHSPHACLIDGIAEVCIEIFRIFREGIRYIMGHVDYVCDAVSFQSPSIMGIVGRTDVDTTASHLCARSFRKG